jgi:hypothetical protein
LAQAQFAFQPPQLRFAIKDSSLRDMVERLCHHAESLLGPAGVAAGLRQQVQPVRRFDLGPGLAIGNLAIGNEAFAQLVWSSWTKVGYGA